MSSTALSQQTKDRTTAALADAATAINAALRRFLDQAAAECHLTQSLADAIAYSSLSGGKRLRPALCLLSAEAAGGHRSTAMPAAVALELVHCFSLVHDDLPAMDDDDLRRGRPTLHVHAGEAMAILGGDAMLALAFHAVSAGPEESSPAVRLTLTSELASATAEMISGQVLDTLGGDDASMTDQQRLALTHRLKTAALLRAACRMGATAGGADEASLRALTEYGEAVGIMFQIVDDLLDVTQSTEHTGKATGKDQTAGKLTFPGLMGIEASFERVGELRERARNAVEPMGNAARPLTELADYLAARTR